MNKQEWAEALSTHPLMKDLQDKCQKIRGLFPRDHIATPIPKEYTIRQTKQFITELLSGHGLGRLEIKSALPNRNKIEFKKDMCWDTIVVVVISDEYELEDVIVITQSIFHRMAKYEETARQPAAIKFAQGKRLELSEKHSLYNYTNNCVTLREDLA